MLCALATARQGGHYNTENKADDYIPRWMSVSTDEVTLSPSLGAAAAAAAAATGLQFHLSYWNWYWHSTSPSLAPSPTHGIASGLRRHTSSCWSTNPGNRPHISPAPVDAAEDDSSDCRWAPGRVTGAVDNIAVCRPMYLSIAYAHASVRNNKWSKKFNERPHHCLVTPRGGEWLRPNFTAIIYVSQSPKRHLDWFRFSHFCRLMNNRHTHHTDRLTTLLRV